MKSNIIVAACALVLFMSVKHRDDPSRIIPSEIKYTDSLPGDSPYLTKNNKGEIVLSWVKMLDDSSSIFCYATSTDDGKNFENITVIPSSKNIYAHAENIPKVIFKPSGEILAVWGTKNPSPQNKYSGLIYYAQSFDNGKTWSEAKKLVNDPAGFDQRYSDVTLLKNGEAAIMWLDNRKQTGKEGSGVFFAVTKGSDGFTNEKLISGPSCQCCRTSLFADSKGNIHALYRGILNDSIRDMVYIVSTDEGSTFTSPKKIYNDNWVLRGCPHTGPAMAENKQGLHFAWYTGARSSGSFYAGTTDNGNTFVNRDNITQQGSHPQLASINNDRIAIAWDEPVQKGNAYKKRIGVQLRAPGGERLLKDYVTPDSLYATYPVISGTKDNGAVMAFCARKGNKNYIAYQRVNFIAPKDNSY